MPIFAVIGNHDYGGNAQAQIDYSKLSNQWHMLFRFYNVKMDNLINLTVIDGWYFNYCLWGDNCTINFSIDSLKSNKAAVWNIVVGNYPMTTPFILPQLKVAIIREI